MLSIGEFSQATHLSVKTLRLYHEKGILVPAHVDSETGYRHYDEACLERAWIIVHLRELELPLAEIAEVLAAGGKEADVAAILERQRDRIEAGLRRQKKILRSLKEILNLAKEATVKSRESIGQCVEKKIGSMTVAGIRMRGRYEECGKLFGKLGKALWRHIRGKPLNLYYDGEYREDDADFESCFPVNSGTACRVEGVVVHELVGGDFMTLIHKGPYEELGRSYAVVFEHVRKLDLRPLVPSREVYLKGPGMFFRGNPKNYLTEIQVPVEAPPKA